MNYNIDIFKSIKDQLLEKDGLMIVESQKAVTKLLKLNTNILCFLCDKNEFSKWSHLISGSTQVIKCTKSELEELVGYSVHKGVMALVDRPKFVEIESFNGPIIVLNGVTSPENIGSIVRTMVGLEFTNLLIDQKSCSPYIRRCIRVSTGNSLHLNVARSANLIEDLATLKKSRTLLCSAADGNNTFAHQYQFKGQDVLIMGSEGHGVDESIRKLCKTGIKVPVSDITEHYNVANATSMLLYEWSRQAEFSNLVTQAVQLD